MGDLESTAFLSRYRVFIKSMDQRPLPQFYETNPQGHPLRFGLTTLSQIKLEKNITHSHITLQLDLSRPVQVQEMP